MQGVKAIEWIDGRVRLLDQTRLPQEEVYLDLEDHQQMAAAIREMRVRGAPLIGIAAAYGMALGARHIDASNMQDFLARLRQVAEDLSATRPTAVNLPWALKRMTLAAEAAADPQAASEALVAEALRIHQENTDADRRLGQHGAQFIPAGSGVLTHCNTGSLATGGYGTALGVIRAAWEQGKLSRVYASETRPLLQGARLTAWELTRDGIPATLIVEGAVGLLMRRPQAIACVIVGADRIAANGDVANKIGTYNLAVLAKEHAIPFYVAAPTSTIDLGSASGDQIPIEERPPEEVTTFAGAAVAPAGIEALNPAFDVTPHRYVSAIITERGIAREPYAEALSQLFQQEGVRHA
ncbi:MAG: methylthioribose-1-phosphate isomerase [Dehalococcoidia bacterium SM23_28_2]|nr:MAG: methylthioribose-1-phosphate isomerase [Dehalococcoidia bacterium SM23_28_2]